MPDRSLPVLPASDECQHSAARVGEQCSRLFFRIGRAHTAKLLVGASVSLVGFPTRGSSFVARTQVVSDTGSIGATEDTATGGETPPETGQDFRTRPLAP